MGEPKLNPVNVVRRVLLIGSGTCGYSRLMSAIKLGGFKSREVGV